MTYGILHHEAGQIPTKGWQVKATPLLTRRVEFKNRDNPDPPPVFEGAVPGWIFTFSENFPSLVHRFCHDRDPRPAICHNLGTLQPCVLSSFQNFQQIVRFTFQSPLA